jgi:hypothetical protein
MDPVGDRLDAPVLEEALRERTPRIGEHDLAAEPREQLEKLGGVPRLVEQVGTEDEVERRLRKKHARLVPAHALDTQDDVISIGVRAEQCNRIVGPVGGEDVGAEERRSERGQSEARAELDDALPFEVERLDGSRKHDPTRPQLGPVGQELVGVERRFVDQLVGARRTQERQRPSG